LDSLCLSPPPPTSLLCPHHVSPLYPLPVHCSTHSFSLSQPRIICILTPYSHHCSPLVLLACADSSSIRSCFLFQLFSTLAINKFRRTHFTLRIAAEIENSVSHNNRGKVWKSRNPGKRFGQARHFIEPIVPFVDRSQIPASQCFVFSTDRLINICSKHSMLKLILRSRLFNKLIAMLLHAMKMLRERPKWKRPHRSE
jgi:hypothetical protein